MRVAILSQTDHRRAVGHRLRRLIDLLGLSYVDAAEVMGVSKHVLRNWMAGDHYPQPYALYRLCMLKGVNFDFPYLGDWAALPHRLAEPLEAELRAALVVGEALEPTGDGLPRTSEEASTDLEGESASMKPSRQRTV